MEDGEEYEGSDAAHNLLINAVSKLDKTQHIKVPTRSESTNLNSEFNLVKNSKKINLNNVVKVLGNTAQHVQISKKLKNTQNHSKILKKPLEKPQAERLKRSSGYVETKTRVGRWDPVVSLNRTLDCVYFPLKQSKDKLQLSGEFISKFELKSPLELELDKVDPPAPVEEEEEEEPVYPMTYQEMLEQRDHMAKMRALQSFKAAKAKRQSKIKSKKYHRILKKEKLKKQLKEFEELQKTDPEEALKKLDALEKERALERHTLRHKNTGKWAKSKLVRAKYDKDVRQQLAEQLSVARNLTKKIQDPETSEEENDNNEDVTLSQDPMNPWMLKRSDKSNIDAEFDFGYKQYLKDKTLNKKDDSESENDDKSPAPALNIKLHQEDSNVELHECQPGVDVKESYDCDFEENTIIADKVKSVVENKKIGVVSKNKNKRQLDTEGNGVELNVIKPDTRSKIKKHKRSVPISTDDWEVCEIESPEKEKIDKTLTEAFDSLESTIADKVSKKLKLMKQQVEKQVEYKKSFKHIEKPDRDNLKYLEFKKQEKAVIDEELMENTSKDPREYTNNEDLLKEASKPVVNYESNGDNIDPNRFIQAKPKYLNTAITEGDNDVDALDDDEQIVPRVNIEDVFEDDDVVASFRQDKADEINKNKPELIDLSLPGWGQWGGKGIKAPKRKRNRFITRGAPITPRRDDNKGDIIIKEYKDPKLTAHKITEVPFPFKTVRDFEASIRAPLGNTFIPENAHRKLIQPSKITKAGTIINPMDEDELISNKTMKYMNKTVIEMLSKNKKK